MSTVAARFGRRIERYVKRYGEAAVIRRTPEASGGYSPDPVGDPATLGVGAHAVVGQYAAHLVDDTTITASDSRLVVITDKPWTPIKGRDSVEVGERRYSVQNANAHRLAGRVIAWDIQGRA
jgi:hypothetical protein